MRRWVGMGYVFLGLGLSLALVVLGLGVGSAGFDHGLMVFWHASAEATDEVLAQQILWEIRLPRTLGAWAAGALLGLAGALAQGLFRNPLADPYLLGSASGASMAVAMALAVLGGGGTSPSGWLHLGLTGVAFLGAVLAVGLTLLLSRGVGHRLRLLLSGVVVGVVLGAATQLVLLFAPNALLAMQGFLLGSTAFVGWTSTLLMGAVWAGCVLVASLLARLLDGLSLGDATALSLGLRVGPLRWALMGVLALCTGTAVAQTGLIGFVGLAAPHLVRSLVKSTQVHWMVLSSLAGGVLLLAADILARGLIAPQELPVGVLTAVLGGGYLLWLMHRGPLGQGAEK